MYKCHITIRGQLKGCCAIDSGAQPSLSGHIMAILINEHSLIISVVYLHMAEHDRLLINGDHWGLPTSLLSLFWEKLGVAGWNHNVYTRALNYDSITSNHALLCQVVVTGNSTVLQNFIPYLVIFWLIIYWIFPVTFTWLCMAWLEVIDS